MTTAEFIAWALWPIVALFVVLLAAISHPRLRLYVIVAAISAFFVYFVLGLLYWRSSIAGVTDAYLFGVMFSLTMFGLALRRLMNGGQGSPRLSKWKLVVALVLGAAGTWLFASTLYSDYAEPRLVIEGRVESLRGSGKRIAEHLADIGGHTVKATTPVYDRLKFKPYVRAEIGRGSNYIFDIEYLAD
ncbi:hypothetical protein ABIB06_003189 [Bradyrhizobium sp. LB8.2]|jgi:hypothetical protein|uniref:hypothetical protein n=1 Tax=unclassified Bradyrhizobium TaxID=2631580 RepID=UPI001FF7E796|nr:hypothetical protein [Bradyrhizobium sp. 197]MCK1475805.1 hypothetical protein [Bradyrhizobium sp. 197]